MVHDPRTDKGRQGRLEDIDFEEFKKIFSIFPKGNPSSAHAALRYAVAFDITFFGDVVTKDLIYDAWQTYLRNMQNEGRENRYIKSFESFIKSKDYQNVEPEEHKETWLDKLKKGNPDDDYEL